MAGSGGKASKVMFGMRILSPRGYVTSEIWFHPDIDEVTVTSMWPNGLPEKVERCTVDRFISVLQRARDAKQS